MRWKVSSSNTGSDDSASSAAERDSGVDPGLTAACGGFAGLTGFAATAGLAGAAFGAINVGCPATLPCASAVPDAAAKTNPAIAITRIEPASRGFDAYITDKVEIGPDSRRMAER